MGILKLRPESLDLSELSPINETKYEAENILKDINYKIKSTYPSSSTSNNDPDIKSMFAINALNLEFNQNLFELREDLEDIVFKCKEIIQPVYTTIDSFTFKYDDIKKPKKSYKAFFIGAIVTFVIMVLSFIGSFIGDEPIGLSGEGIGALVFLLILAIILASTGFKKKKNFDEKNPIYENFINVELPNRIAKLENEWSQKINHILNSSIKKYNELMNTPKNTPIFYRNQLSIAESQLKDKLYKYLEEFGTFIRDDELLVEILDVINDKRAKNLSEAVNTVKNDRHMTKIEEMQRQQRDYARDTAIQARRQAEAAEYQSIQTERQAEAAERQAKAAEKQAKASEK